VELLLEVFHISTSDIMAPNVMPATLSHVSKLWRDLILHAPKLWTKILVVEDLGPDVTEFEKTIDRVQFFLAHSAACALDVHIELRTFCDSYMMDDLWHPFHDIIDQFRQCTRSVSLLLAPHIWRIKSFNLDCDEFKPICDVQSSFPRVPMAMLEALRVRQLFEQQSFQNVLGASDANELTAIAISVPLVPRYAVEEMYPKLRSAILATVPVDWQRFCPKNLHTLEISFLPITARPNGRMLRQILLANEHSLESLTIHGAGPADYVPEPFVMSNVRHLDLGYAYPQELIHLVKCMRVPNLVTLNIIDLRRKLMFAPQRRNLSYDDSPLALFHAIIDEFPLHQVKEVELRQITFMPDFILLPLFPEIQIVPNLSRLPIPTTPLHFFCKLTALKSLTIVDPDPGTLHALNYLPPLFKNQRPYDDSQFTHVPVPVLDFLHLVDFNFPLVRFFLKVRCNHHISFRRLFLLMLNMPVGWILDFDSLFLLADDVQLFDTILEPAVEADLLIPPPVTLWFEHL